MLMGKFLYFVLFFPTETSAYRFLQTVNFMLGQESYCTSWHHKLFVSGSKNWIFYFGFISFDFSLGNQRYFTSELREKTKKITREISSFWLTELLTSRCRQRSRLICVMLFWENSSVTCKGIGTKMRLKQKLCLRRLIMNWIEFVDRFRFWIVFVFFSEIEGKVRSIEEIELLLKSFQELRFGHKNCPGGAKREETLDIKYFVQKSKGRKGNWTKDFCQAIE